MNFEKFIGKLKEEIKNGLPGWEIQKRMAAPGRPRAMSDTMKGKQPRQSAVLLWLYPNKETIFVRLIVRTASEDVHSGQVAFPGGSYDEKDQNFWQTALREASEEIGLPSDDIHYVGELSPLYIPPSNFLVHPFIGVSEAFKSGIISEFEVQKYFDVDINQLPISHQSALVSPKSASGVFSLEVPCYNLSDHIVWGATAMILSEFEELVRRTRSKKG